MKEERRPPGRGEQRPPHPGWRKAEGGRGNDFQQAQGGGYYRGGGGPTSTDKAYGYTMMAFLVAMLLCCLGIMVQFGCAKQSFHPDANDRANQPAADGQLTAP